MGSTSPLFRRERTDHKFGKIKAGNLMEKLNMQLLAEYIPDWNDLSEEARRTGTQSVLLLL